MKRIDKREMEELREDVRVNERFEKKLTRSKFKWVGQVEKWETKGWQREQMPRKWRTDGGEEVIDCDGRTA